METCGDFLEYLGPDMSAAVLSQLDDPSDLVRMSAVSRSWRRFIIDCGFSKKLCLQLFPEFSHIKLVIEISSSKEPSEPGTSKSVESDTLERDHRVYAHLTHCLLSPMEMKDCIVTSINASSTDNDPDENIENTLDPRERVDGRHSYWSSRGENDPEVPETLTYKLRSQICIIKELKIKPFQATFQHDHPIYSSKSVRFRMGLPKFPLDVINDEFMSLCSDNSYNWTYVSPEFPMAQENLLQTFELPKPVICIGGVLQIELLGRIQRQEIDNLYYICVCHVQAIGRSLWPLFDIDTLNSAGSCVLKYSPVADNCLPLSDSPQDDDAGGSSGWQAIAARIRQIREGRVWNQVVLLNTLLGGNDVVSDNDSDGELTD